MCKGLTFVPNFMRTRVFLNVLLEAESSMNKNLSVMRNKTHLYYGEMSFLWWASYYRWEISFINFEVNKVLNSRQITYPDNL